MKVLVGEAKGWATRWNPFFSVPAEVIVQFEDGSADSVPFPELTVDDVDALRAYLNEREL